MPLQCWRGSKWNFIALDSLIQQAESEGKVDVYGYVSQMRKQRCNMIQTLDQYIFLHDAILEASEGFDTTISLAEFKSEYDIIKQDQLTGKGQLDALYLKLQDLLYVDRNTDATSKDNLAKNRCANIIPFNERRVMLINMPSDYINATYVDDHRKRSALIATQHPLSSTVEDFWKMVQTQKPFAVVTLCGASAVDECNDKKSLPKFWPTPECRTKEFTTVSVELLEEAELEKISSVVMQKLTVHCKNQAMYQSKPADVDHYICNFWPSQKTLPTDTESFVKLVAMIERRKQENDDRQIVINCYDGAKQSGLYITCHALLQQILIDGEVDIPETVKLIRNDQPMFIPHVDQFKFCYEFVSRYVDSSTQDSAVFTCL
ncbi:hypothetical protein EB796_001973 [Bugula neritina]|uniref:protein-tyrosine-phosphatase n=1 Tax=Bugula neritina TaxID=10212 RepID=A0A7J7KNI4_BUGNE|nr:hypothetical protein EB796_001973 [Bugula neritina]